MEWRCAGGMGARALGRGHVVVAAGAGEAAREPYLMRPRRRYGQPAEPMMRTGVGGGLRLARLRRRLPVAALVGRGGGDLGGDGQRVLRRQAATQEECGQHKEDGGGQPAPHAFTVPRTGWRGARETVLPEDASVKAP